MSTTLEQRPVTASAVPLKAATAETVRDELGLVDPTDITGKNIALDAKDQTQVDAWTKQLIDFDLKDSVARNKRVAAVESIGANVQKEAAQASKLLEQPIRKLGSAGAEGSSVANALTELKVTVDGIDPGKMKLLAPGSIGRFFSYLPGVGVPLNRYFTKFQSAGSVIEAILNSLRDGADQLKRDNDTLLDDQARMRELTFKLERQIAMGIKLDEQLSAFAETLAVESEKRKFVEEELLFPLRQRIGDLQQQLAVNQQGIVSIELIRQNNVELIRGARRCENVTVNALRVAVTVAMALANQRIVIGKIKAIDETTNRLLANNAQTLRTQGVQIHKDAASQKLDMAILRQSFTDLNAALDDISRFRQEALPAMSENIREMGRLTGETEKVITRIESSARNRTEISLEVK